MRIVSVTTWQVNEVYFGCSRIWELGLVDLWEDLEYKVKLRASLGIFWGVWMERDKRILKYCVVFMLDTFHSLKRIEK